MSNSTHIGSVYNAISNGLWSQAMRSIQQNPTEASQWIVRDTYNDQTQKEEECRVLPIHTACALNPPLNLVKELLGAYPEGPSFTDNQGLYPLHYACGNFASAEVVELVRYAFPEAIKLTDPNGMLPLHHMTLWGISSPKSLDAILTHCDDQVYHTKDVDGNTPLDLAYMSEENEHVEYIISQLEARYTENITSEESEDSEKKCGEKNIEVPQDVIVKNMSQESISSSKSSVGDNKNNQKYNKRSTSQLTFNEGILIDESKINNLQSELSMMAAMCAEYKKEQEKDSKLINIMKKELKSFKTKLAIAEKENAMINTYRSQNKSLESSLANFKNELQEYKKKWELLNKEQDMLESYKEQNRLLETTVRGLKEKLSQIHEKSTSLEEQNGRMCSRVTTFANLTRFMYNSMKSVMEQDEAFNDIKGTIRTLDNSNGKGDNAFNCVTPILCPPVHEPHLTRCPTESTNYESLMDDLILDDDAEANKRDFIYADV